MTSASIAELVVEAGLMSAEEVARVLSPERLSGIQAATDTIAIIPSAAREAALKESEDQD